MSIGLWYALCLVHVYAAGGMLGEKKKGPGDYFFSFNHQGIQRQYIVHVPRQYRLRSPLPLILNFHGNGGSAEGHRFMTDMDRLADKQGCIVVYPRGTRTDGDSRKKHLRFWNPGPGPQGESNTNAFIKQIDDVGFIDTLLDALEKDFDIDKRRVYAVGFSNGACLTHLLGCRLSQRIAAIATVGGPFWSIPEECRPQLPVSVIHFHGTADECAPYAGGPSGCERGIAGSGRIFASAQETVAIWRDKNSCTGEPELTYTRGDVSCLTYTKCIRGTEVTLCTIRGVEHTWPGGRGYTLPGVTVGKVSYDINANETLWEFFLRHARDVRQ